MGQKISPIDFRIGITENWRSCWFAKGKRYGQLAVEDEKIRSFIKTHYSFAGIPRIDIERTHDRTDVIIYAARPGLLIGRKGAQIEKLTEDLIALVKHPINVRIIEVEKPELSAQLIAESIVDQLEKRAPYRRVMHQAIETVMSNGGLGVKIVLSGRLAGAEIHRTEKMSQGKIPLQTIKADIDYGVATAILTKGTIGVKVWIYKGEKLLPKKEKF